MTLPDNEEDYIHRSGRVGRQDRWGLCISLVATQKEKVWYHSCPSRGKSCSDTRLKEQGGCCIWFDWRILFPQYLTTSSFHTFFPAYLRSLSSLLFRYDEPALWKAVVTRLGGTPIPTLEEHLKKRSKVTYGADRNSVSSLSSHSSSIANSVDTLRILDKQVQDTFINTLLNYS